MCETQYSEHSRGSKFASNCQNSKISPSLVCITTTDYLTIGLHFAQIQTSRNRGSEEVPLSISQNNTATEHGVRTGGGGVVVVVLRVDSVGARGGRQALTTDELGEGVVGVVLPQVAVPDGGGG